MLAIYFSSNMYFKMINEFDSTRKKRVNLVFCQICDLCAVYEEISLKEVIKVYELPQHRWRPQGQAEGPQSSRAALLCL